MNFSGSILALERPEDPLIILVLLPFTLFGLARASSKVFGTPTMRLSTIILWLGALLNVLILGEIISFFAHHRTYLNSAQEDLGIFLSIVIISLPVALLAGVILAFDRMRSSGAALPEEPKYSRVRAAMIGADMLSAPFLFGLLFAVKEFAR